jgi:hypothetical protein
MLVKRRTTAGYQAGFRAAFWLLAEVNNAVIN